MATISISRKSLFYVALLAVLAVSAIAIAAVPHGSAKKAEAYYRVLADVLEFKDSATISQSVLDDVLVYVGYAGLSARDLQQVPPDVLMDPINLAKACRTQPNGVPSCPTTVFIAGDILASRFFAPKIINVNAPPDTRELGWRKLIRLRSRPGSPADKHSVQAAIILFNFFTKPGERPFADSAESVNTQVMLITAAGGKDSIYWLDYGRLSEGGKLSLALDASFDAADFEDSPVSSTGKIGIKPYYVPDGCVACHGNHENRSLVNYLDTDHWFDRADNDFARIREEGSPVLFDAHSDDPTTSDFKRAFAVIKQFNKEAEQQASAAQPKSFHRLAAETWLRLHDTSVAHFPPIERAVSSSESWSSQSPTEKELIEKLNRYCFRCHGTIMFNIFDKAEVKARHTQIESRLQPSVEQRQISGFRMPLDRTIDKEEISRILQLLP